MHYVHSLMHIGCHYYQAVNRCQYARITSKNVHSLPTTQRANPRDKAHCVPNQFSGIQNIDRDFGCGIDSSSSNDNLINIFTFLISNKNMTILLTKKNLNYMDCV